MEHREQANANGINLHDRLQLKKLGRFAYTLLYEVWRNDRVEGAADVRKATTASYVDQSFGRAYVDIGSE